MLEELIAYILLISKPDRLWMPATTVWPCLTSKACLPDPVGAVLLGASRSIDCASPAEDTPPMPHPELLRLSFGCLYRGFGLGSLFILHKYPICTSWVARILGTDSHFFLTRDDCPSRPAPGRFGCWISSSDHSRIQAALPISSPDLLWMHVATS